MCVRAPAVHVRVRQTPVAAILIEVPLEPELAEKWQPDIDHEDDEMPDVLVIDDDVNRQRQHGEEQQIDEAEAEQRLQIKRNLESRITFRGLRRDTGQHDDAEEEREHGDERRQLREEGGHVRQRRRVRDLADLDVTLRPNQLAGVKGDDDEHEQAEAAIQNLDHLVRDGPRRRPVELPDLLRDENDVKDSGADDRIEVGVTHDPPERARRQGPILNEPTPCVEPPRGRGQLDRSHGSRRRHDAFVRR